MDRSRAMIELSLVSGSSPVHVFWFFFCMFAGAVRGVGGSFLMGEWFGLGRQGCRRVITSLTVTLFSGSLFSTEKPKG